MAVLRAAGVAGPVLVVADNTAIARAAPAWADAFAAAGWLHRVLAADPAGDDEVAAIAAEAASCDATAIVAAGDAAVVSVAERAAAVRRVPCVVLPSAVG
ncbi:MAG: hypothetical protein ACKO40_08985 [Planctomycetaceae bacterium]